jgi:hypothetical protein
MEVRAWNFSNTHALAEVLSPAQDKGTAYLRADKKMWSYLPKAKQVVQLPASMLMQGWMGSDLQLDQLVLLAPELQLLKHQLVPQFQQHQLVPRIHEDPSDQ